MMGGQAANNVFSDDQLAGEFLLGFELLVLISGFDAPGLRPLPRCCAGWCCSTRHCASSGRFIPTTQTSSKTPATLRKKKTLNPLMMVTRPNDNQSSCRSVLPSGREPQHDSQHKCTCDFIRVNSCIGYPTTMTDDTSKLMVVFEAANIICV